MCKALDDHEGSVNIGGRLITNFRFADDIVVNAEEEDEAGVLVDRLDTTTTRYKLETGPWWQTTQRDLDKMSEVRSSGELQVPWSNHLLVTMDQSRIPHLRAAEDSEGWKGIVATSSVVPRRPSRLRDWNETRWWQSQQNVPQRRLRSDDKNLHCALGS